MWPLSVGMAGLQEVSHNASLCFSCVLRAVIVLCLTASTRGLTMAQAQDTVDIFPVEPSFHVGGNLTLTCAIRRPSALLARDLTWSRDGVALSPDLYSALDDRTSRLLVRDAQFADSGLYACLAPKQLPESGNETQVYIGVPPSRAADVTCFCRNYIDVTCTWAVRGNTNLNTTHTLQYHIIHENSLWIDCDAERGKCVCPDAQSCTVLSTVHWPAIFRVVSANSLGSAVSHNFTFDLEKETVPFPPRNAAARAIPRSRLNVTFDLPAEWKSYYETDLHYKLQYWQEGSGSAVQMEYLLSAEFPGRRYAELPSPNSLDAFTDYCIRAAARLAKNAWSDWSPAVCQRTLEGKPDAKINASWTSRVNAKNDSQRDVVVKWQPLPKSHARGVIREYRVSDATDPHSTFKQVASLERSKTSLILPGLERYKRYRFALEAVNGAGASPITFLDITAEYRSTIPVAVIVAVILVGSIFIVGAIVVGVYCIKHSRLLKPVPRISFIALDKFDRFLSRPIHRGMAEREVFDEPPGRTTPNGVVPDAGRGPAARDDPEAGGVAGGEEGDDEYVMLRGGSASGERLPLLEAGGGVAAADDGDAHRLSQASGDSARSTDGYVVKQVYPVAAAQTTAPGAGRWVGKFDDKLFVELPPPTAANGQSGPNQPRLDSTDSGFAENCTEYRMPSYSRMSAIPADSDVDEAPSSDRTGGDHGSGDADSVDSGSDVYHRLAAAGEPATAADQSHRTAAYMNRDVPAYTRLSSIPNVLFNGMPPSVGQSELILDSNGNLPNATLPSLDRSETGNS